MKRTATLSSTHNTFYALGGALLSTILFVSFLVTPINAKASDVIDSDNSSVSFQNFASSGDGFDGLVEEGDETASEIGQRNESLRLLEFGFGDFQNDFENAEAAGLANELDTQSDIAPAVIGKPLVYPNPVSFRTHGRAVLDYKLSKDMPIEIHLYDMMSNRIIKRTYPKFSDGGSKNSRIKITSETFGGHQLSAGVYFWYIIHEGQVLGKAKMAVVP